MTQEIATKAANESDRLSLYYDGGIADTGSLLLDEYAASLAGWRSLLQLLGELYFYSFPELRKIRGSDLLRIEIVAERGGSYESVLYFVLGAAAGGIIGNRADAGAVWTFRKLTEWYREAISKYVQKKTETTDITAIAAALREMTERRGIPLEHEVVSEESQALFSPPNEQLDEADYEIEPPPIDRAQALAEKLDHTLKQATQPLEHSCERMKVLRADKSPILEIGPAERGVISAPLTLPPPKREWRPAKVKFERINRKTGRALFYFDGEDVRSQGAHYSRIVDPTVRKPHNRYTQAFNDDEPLDVWIRQTHPEKGRLNVQWEITAKDPDQKMLFDIPPPM